MGHKNLHLITGGMAAVASLFLLLSCTSDDFPDGGMNAGGRCDNICFGISDAAVTRGEGGGEGERTAARFVLRASGTPDTLCVRATVADGINLSADGGASGATRAAPITTLDGYGKFHVQAHCTDGGKPVGEFYMDDDAAESGGVWSTATTYFWPGASRTLDFYAWAPVDAGFSATPQAPASTTLGYTVPSEATQQKDIVVAKAEAIDGDYNAAVPLTFSHVCTAVRFVTGSQMQPGTIKSVSLKGVRLSGSYDMVTGEWALQDGTADFTQALGHETTGSEAAGSGITPDEGTFMMLPQTLPQGATVEVVFTDKVTGQDRTLSASIAGTEWPQGKTVTYRLSITPEYDLEFISEPEVQDAHYVIYPIHIKAGEVPGGWTMTSTDPSVTLRTDLTTLTRRGYWIEEDRGTASISSTATGEDITVYAFLEENIGDETREVNLELRPTNMPNAQPQVFNISQLCPSWNGDLGCERIEEYDDGFTGYPWGFKWDGVTITYDLGNFLEDYQHTGLRIILLAYLNLFSNYPWVHDNGILGGIFGYEITFDFDEISSLDVALSDDNGLQNTWDTYNFQGLNDASSLMQLLEENGYEADNELPSNPTYFAARACAMKNKFNKSVQQQNGQTVEIAVLNEDNLVWYLPAKNEAPNMLDEEYTLSGEYWTSTAINDNVNAWSYAVGSSTAQRDRDTNLKVRAVRKKP